MTKFLKSLRYIFISSILVLIYLPIFFLVVFSFNRQSIKGDLSFDAWNGFSSEAYSDLFKENQLIAFANSTVIAFVTTLLVVTLSVLIVFALWRQKSRIYNTFSTGVLNIPLINPDIITALSLGIIFTAFGSQLALGEEGIIRAILAHVVSILPFAVLIMFPFSEKFNPNLFKASYDLGYSKIRTWFKVYLRYMLGPIFLASLVTIVLSFDDFILARIVSNTETVGSSLYVGKFKPWALALGSILMFILITSNLAFIVFRFLKKRKLRSKKEGLKTKQNNKPLLFFNQIKKPFKIGQWASFKTIPLIRKRIIHHDQN